MATAKKVSVSALGTPDKDGFLTKQGGAIKTWKKRWFVLKGDTLYYFKTQKDPEQTGEIKLEATSACQPEQKKKGKYYFSVGTPARVYLMFSDSEETMKQWVDKISKSIDAITGGDPKPPVDPANDDKEKEKEKDKTDTTTTPTPPEVDKEKDSSSSGNTGSGSTATGSTSTPNPTSGSSTEKKISAAKNVIPFLQDEESKVLEFWKIWSESIPSKEDLSAGNQIEYHVSTSANRQKLTWRTAGPQNVFIQKMVDFFWNVGAPESEIDRLNDVGALINPIKIGSWIDMSAKGGMDGGWYFPVDIPLKMAIEAADPGEPSKKVTEWAAKHSVEKSFSVGRDMGAAPPRQTEIRVHLPGTDFGHQLEVGLDAFESFGFPPLPENALSILKSSKISGLCLSVITSSEGFVRLGLLCPNPPRDVVQQLCSIAGASADDVIDFETALESSGPSFAEYQFLKEGFGYGVYKEGFDIVFHYVVGGEGPDD